MKLTGKGKVVSTNEFISKKSGKIFKFVVIADTEKYEKYDFLADGELEVPEVGVHVAYEVNLTRKENNTFVFLNKLSKV
jgi:hypothetical protein